MNEKLYQNQSQGGQEHGVEATSARDCLRFRLLGLAVHLPDDLLDVDDLVGVLLQHLLRRQAGAVASVPVTETDCGLENEFI